MKPIIVEWNLKRGNSVFKANLWKRFCDFYELEYALQHSLDEISINWWKYREKINLIKNTDVVKLYADVNKANAYNLYHKHKAELRIPYQNTCLQKKCD